MAGFVLGHFVDGVVDGVVAQLLGAGSDGELAFAGTGLGLIALLEVGLGVPDDLAEEFGDAGGMVGFFQRIAAEGLSDLGIALAVRLTAHGEIHTHLGAFAGEVLAEPGQDFGIHTLGDAKFMLAGPLRISTGGFLDFDEFFGLSMAYGALCGGILAFVDVAADEASEFLFHFVVRK